MTTPIAISVKDAAAEIGCSPSHLYRLARAGELPGAYRMGGRWFIAIEAFHAHFGVTHETEAVAS